MHELHMPDVSPSSFDSLIAELYAIPLDRHNRYRSDFVYRGLDVSIWACKRVFNALGRNIAMSKARCCVISSSTP
jgi:hypothetical protein